MAAFGFSAGDFITCLGLINNISQALKDSTGSASDFNALNQTLQSLSQAIAASEVIYLQWSDLPTTATFKANSRAMINGMLFQRQRCRLVMEEFLKAARPYTDAFVHERGKSVVRSWRKIRWIYQKDMVLKLERNLKGHMEALRIYTDALFQNHMAATAESMESKMGILLSSFSNVQADVSMIVQALQASRISSIGYPWEASSSPADNVQLLDANGRTLLLPMLFLSTPWLFHDILKITYQGIPGRRKIMQREYTITDEDVDGPLIEESNWGKVIRPGMRISLNMILQATSWNNRQRCPKCNEPTLGHVLAGKRVRCQKCQLTFRLFEKERFIDDYGGAETVGNEPAPSTAPFIEGEEVKEEFAQSQKSTKTKSKAKKDLDEESYFNRVHYHHEIWKKRLVRAAESKDEEKPNVLKTEDLPPLHKAAATGDLSRITTLLDDGYNIDAPLPFRAILSEDNSFQFEGCSPLQIAAFFGKSKALDLLLDRGADVNARDADKAEILEYAISGEKQGLVMKLLAKGANTRSKNKYGRSVLHCAVEYGDLLLFYLLVEYGADATEEDEEGGAPIHAAAFYGNEAVVKALLEQDSSMASMREKDGSTPLHNAVMKADIKEEDHVKLIRALIEHGSDVNARQEDDCTPLLEAAWNGHNEIAKVLVEKGANIDAQRDDGSTPLHDAAWNGHVEVLKLLLKQGANIEIRRKDGLQPIHDAARKGHEQIIKELVSKGANLNSPGCHGRTPLSEASRQGHHGLVKTLLAIGADIAAQDDFGSAALSNATQCSNVAVVKELLVGGADLKAVDKWGQTPLHTSIQGGNEQLVSLLLDHGAEVNAQTKRKRTPLHLACHFGLAHIAKVLVERGADTTLCEEGGFSPLIQAIRCRKENVVPFLLKEIHDVDARGLCKETALHWASMPGYGLGLSSLLIESGADVNLQDMYGDTPLHKAARSGFKGLVELLLTSGSNPYIRNANDETPLGIAIRLQRNDVTLLLQQATEKVDLSMKTDKLDIDVLDTSLAKNVNTADENTVEE